MRAIVTKFCYSEDIELQQRCAEFLHFIEGPEPLEEGENGIASLTTKEWGVGMEQLRTLLPEDSSCWDIDVDPEMAFLDDYIGHLVCFVIRWL